METNIINVSKPTLGLSPLLCQRLAQQITSINQEGIAVVLVEQNARMALRFAQRGYVLETGSIVVEGPSEVLLENPEVKRAYLGG